MSEAPRLVDISDYHLTLFVHGFLRLVSRSGAVIASSLPATATVSSAPLIVFSTDFVNINYTLSSEIIVMRVPSSALLYEKSRDRYSLL